jgi:hypothetical protein
VPMTAVDLESQRLVRGGRPTRRGPLGQWEELARELTVAWSDVLLTALNVYGLRTPLGARTRLYVSIPGDPAERLVVVPSDQAGSPFELADTGQLLVAGTPVATVRRAEHDDAVSGYLRCWDGGRWRAATVNPNSRCRCTGCAFCPTTLEDAVDPRLRLDEELAQLLAGLAAELPPGGKLTDLTDITVSTGCFHTEAAGLEHLGVLRRVLDEHGIDARIGFLSSVLRSDEAFARLAAECSPVLLFLTAECASRRELLLKSSKASLLPEQMPDLLARAKTAGLQTSFTYIVGLDPFDVMVDFLSELLPHVTVFPSIQIYQAHTPLMDVLRSPDAGDLEYYLRARAHIERLTAARGLVPEPWRCYRSLWYSTYAGARLTGPRI